ncbi:MAG: peptidylprolyl isomerase [Saprospiraceae bacterium]
MKLSLFFSLIILGILSCDIIQREQKIPDQLLATVYDKTLKISDLSGLFPANANHQDSLKIISNFITRWTQDQVFLTEAEKHIPNDLVIEDLLKRYRESLISLNFQQLLIQENLDSLITDQELREFYEKNKDQYQLETSIIRCYIVKIEDGIREEKNIREWWDNPSDNNLKKLARISEKYNGIYHLQDSIWHNLSDIESIFPKNRISARNWTNGESLSFSANKFLYLFKVFEIVSKQEPAPISYVAPKARLVILNQRKSALLEDFKTKLYETELRKNNVKIFTE